MIDRFFHTVFTVQMDVWAAFVVLALLFEGVRSTAVFLFWQISHLTMPKWAKRLWKRLHWRRRLAFAREWNRCARYDCLDGLKYLSRDGGDEEDYLAVTQALERQNRVQKCLINLQSGFPAFMPTRLTRRLTRRGLLHSRPSLDGWPPLDQISLDQIRKGRAGTGSGPLGL